MARPPRLEFADAVYHVTSHGEAGKTVFEDAEDRRDFLDIAALGMERFGAEVLAWCLMDDEYQFVLRTRQANLSKLMRHINGVYTQAWNRRRNEAGKLFRGRFKAVLIEEDAFLLEVCRHVELTPVRMRRVRSPAKWPWSSYRVNTGAEPAPAWMDNRTLHKRIAPRAPVRDGAPRYAEFVAAGKGVDPWQNGLRRQIFLGSEEFVARLLSAAANPPKRRAARPALARYFKGKDRAEGIMQALREGGYTQTEIAGELGLSLSRISRIVKAQERNAG